MTTKQETEGSADMLFFCLVLLPTLLLGLILCFLMSALEEPHEM